MTRKPLTGKKNKDEVATLARVFGPGPGWWTITNWKDREIARLESCAEEWNDRMEVNYINTIREKDNEILSLRGQLILLREQNAELTESMTEMAKLIQRQAA